MKIKTLQFGEIDVQKSKLIDFEQGLPGFEELRQFVMINADGAGPVYWLQSVEEPQIALSVVDPFELVPDYALELGDQELDALQLEDERELMVLGVTVIPKDIRKMTVNLAAPILINTRQGIGKQIVMDDKRFSTRHPVYDGFCAALRKGGAACAGAQQKG